MSVATPTARTARVKVATAGGVVTYEKVATALGWYWRSDAPRSTLKAALRRPTGFHKVASLGGDPEGSFEQAFSSLAYTYLKDKAPQLLDHVVGFQLMERNEDSTKAVGIFGIKLGDQWLYAPSFFLNGELKGHELLYVKKQDCFVPLKENWINYLKGHEPHLLGQGSKQDAYQLGGLAPDVSRLSNLPGLGKLSCDMQSWAVPYLPVHAAATTKAASYLAGHANLAAVLDLRKVAESDVAYAGALFKAASDYPAIKLAFDRFYGRDFFPKVGRTLRERALNKQASFLVEPPPAPRPRAPRYLVPDPEEKRAEEAAEQRAKLKVYDDVSLTKNRPELDDEERGKLLRDGVLIKDERDPHATSIPYDTQVLQVLANPRESGLYELLEKPTSFDKFLVVSHPYSQNGREDFSTAVRLGDGKAWLNAHPSNLWVRKVEEADAYRDWLEKQDGGTDLKVGSTYVAVGETGDGTVPFVVRDKLSDECYSVDFECYAHFRYERPKTLPSLADGFDSADTYPSYSAKLHVTKARGCKPRTVRGELFVPESYKFLKVKECDEKDPEASKPRPVEPGRLDDIQLLFSEKTAALRLIVDGPDYTVRGRGGDTRRDYKGALVHLVRDHGLTEKAARVMLKEAAYKGSANYRIKYAESYGQTVGRGPDSPSFPAPWLGTEFNGPNAVRANYPQEELLPVPQLDSSRTDPSTYYPWHNFEYDQNQMSTVQEAGESGNKEVFDSSMLSSMLKSMNQTSAIDRYLPALMKSLDKLGRILMMFFYHQEEFADRYGKQDLPELEDSLRNTFENMGDVVLFLKQKSVNTYTDHLGDPDIEDAAED
jgi:hypothetical protein